MNVNVFAHLKLYILGIFCISIAFILSACNAGSDSVPDIYNTSTSGQCQNMVTGTRCTISFDYNNYGQYVGIRVNPALPTLSECQESQANGCGIIYDGSFNTSFNQCSTEFNGNTGSGTCNVTFTYTSGVSGTITNGDVTLIGTDFPVTFVNTYDGASSTTIEVTGN